MADPNGATRARWLLQKAGDFEQEVIDLCSEGIEGKIEIVAGGQWDQPARLREGVLRFRSAYNAEVTRLNEARSKRGRGR